MAALPPNTVCPMIRTAPDQVKYPPSILAEVSAVVCTGLELLGVIQLAHSLKQFHHKGKGFHQNGKGEAPLAPRKLLCLIEENWGVQAHLHEVLVNDIVTLCSDSSHAGFGADVAQIGSVEAL